MTIGPRTRLGSPDGHGAPNIRLQRWPKSHCFNLIRTQQQRAGGAPDRPQPAKVPSPHMPSPHTVRGQRGGLKKASNTTSPLFGPFAADPPCPPRLKYQDRKISPAEGLGGRDAWEAPDQCCAAFVLVWAVVNDPNTTTPPAINVNGVIAASNPQRSDKNWPKAAHNSGLELAAAETDRKRKGELASLHTGTDGQKSPLTDRQM